MAKQAEIERGKSILGKLGKGHSSDVAKTKALKGGKEEDSAADHARTNLVRRI